MPTYATAAQLRDETGFSAVELPDAEADRLLEQAEDLIDDALGAHTLNTTTGRAIDLDDFEDWQTTKLQQATTALAKRLHADPNLAEYPQYASVSGEVSQSGPRGSRYGPRVEALLNASGLRRLSGRATAAVRGHIDDLPRAN